MNHTQQLENAFRQTRGERNLKRCALICFSAFLLLNVGSALAQKPASLERMRNRALQETQKIEEDQQESFVEFLGHFANDATFQASRVQFPLPQVVIRSGLTKDSVMVKKENWKHKPLPALRTEYRVQIYDNFERTLSDSGLRVLSVEGNGNGIDYSLYFKRVEGKWYLVRITDLSL